VVKISPHYFIEEPLMICYNINHLFYLEKHSLQKSGTKWWILFIAVILN